MIVKNTNRGKHLNAKEMLFVYINDPNMNIYSAVREWILPRTHVYLKTADNGDFYLIPTDNTDGYKLNICKGRTSISARALLRKTNIKTRVRIPCEKMEDGSILCKASTVK